MPAQSLIVILPPHAGNSLVIHVCTHNNKERHPSGCFSFFSSFFLHVREKSCTFAGCKRANGRIIIMKKILLITIAGLLAASVCAGEVKIDKKRCVVTKDGKEFPLYGKVKIVDNFEDIKVKIVDNFEGIR